MPTKNDLDAYSAAVRVVVRDELGSVRTDIALMQQALNAVVEQQKQTYTRELTDAMMDNVTKTIDVLQKRMDEMQQEKAAFWSRASIAVSILYMLFYTGYTLLHK